MQLKKFSVPKKPYKAPVLVVHGTVKDLTKNIGRNGTPDGGLIFRVKTGV